MYVLIFLREKRGSKERGGEGEHTLPHLLACSSDSHSWAQEASALCAKRLCQAQGDSYHSSGGPSHRLLHFTCCLEGGSRPLLLFFIGDGELCPCSWALLLKLTLIVSSWLHKDFAFLNFWWSGCWFSVLYQKVHETIWFILRIIKVSPP